VSVDLSTHYLGHRLINPLVASAGPATDSTESIKRLADAGIAAVVLPSLFEEQISHIETEMARLVESGFSAFGEAAEGFLPEMADYNLGPDGYLTMIESAREAVDIPVFASLNGATPGGWVKYASHFESAGASAIELNLYVLATDAAVDARAMEDRYVEIVKSVVDAVQIPVAVKLTPFFSSLPAMARRLTTEAGAEGLVLFNRLYQPEVDLDTLTVRPHLRLSTSAELNMPLRWIAVLRDQLESSIAATTGIHTADDVMKALLVGADVAMMASAILRSGPDHVASVLASVEGWISDHEYRSVTQLKGSMSLGSVPDPESFVRANYLHELTSWSRELP